MTPRQILRDIRDLQVYSESEWREYRAAFDVPEPPAGACDSSSAPEANELQRRILLQRGCAAEDGPWPVSDKIRTMDAIQEQLAQESPALGIVSGCFDLLHLGHVRSMEYAKERLLEFAGARLVVLTLSDEHIAAKKGASRPIMNVGERLAMIAAVQYVDFVTAMTEPNCLGAIERLRPRFFFKAEGDQVQGIVLREVELVERLGGRVEYFPRSTLGTLSTTSLIETVRRRSNPAELAGGLSSAKGEEA